MPLHLSIVSPVYHAEECLPELCRRIIAAAEAITPDFELVLVEDAGPDHSWEVIEQLAGSDPRIKAIRLSRNFGQHYAITAGLDHAHGEWVVVMDCDLQDRPEEIGRLYGKAKEGYDAVFARRMNRKDSCCKTIRSYLFSRVISWLTGTRFDSAVANYSIVSRRAVESFREYRERDRAFRMILEDVGLPIAFIDVEHGARFAGVTSYSWKKLASFATQVVVSASTRPLRMSIRFGALVSIVSILYAIHLVVRFFRVDVGVAGWTSLAVLISFFFGLLFIQLGILGLYLGKTFEESKRRPLYHIAETRNFGVHA